MKKVILLRVGELFLKGKNRGSFEKALLKNLKNALSSFDCKISKHTGRYIISDFDEIDESSIVSTTQGVFGLSSLSVATEIETSKQNIDDFFKNIKLDVSTFRVSVTRADKTFPINSNVYVRELGGYVLSNNPHLKVKLKDFDKELVADIRENGKTYIFTDRIECSGGMPYGTSGKGVLLLSGGIDSPVAGYMMAKRGMELLGLHFHSFPYTSTQAKEKVVELARILKKYTGEFKLICVKFTEVQEEIHKNCAPEFMITIMRRIMMRVASKICDMYSAKAIVTGESLAQVASQTIESINVTNAVATYPVLRPLIAFDKIDTIQIANKIGSYNTSILPYEDCCTVFLPKNPIIKPNIKKVEKEEAKLDIEWLVENCLKTIEIIEI